MYPFVAILESNWFPYTYLFFRKQLPFSLKPRMFATEQGTAQAVYLLLGELGLITSKSSMVGNVEKWNVLNLRF